jgi:corrinoid protein of di/trimethylamine methyltransferase
MSEQEEIDVSQLETPELLRRIQDDLYDGLADDVVVGTGELLRRGLSPYDALTLGLVAGMDVVGVDFRDGILFVPEVLMAAKAMKAGMEILRPLLAETGAPQIGTMVIGTVKGDIHDIGKNLVAMMLEGAGFQVINLGINNDAQKFVDAVVKHNSDLVGLSALLTTTMPYMQVIIKALKEAGLRDKVGVMIGGAPVTQAFADEIGADAYCRDAAIAVETAKRLVAARRD